MPLLAESSEAVALVAIWERLLLTGFMVDKNRKKDMKHSFEYFLNAIHYCLWLGDRKFGDFAEP